MKRTIIATIAALVIVTLILALNCAQIDLEGLRSYVATVTELRERHPGLVIAVFALIYVLVTALSLPIAVWLTLAAGALFGFWAGLAVVSIAATLGATLAFLSARYLLRDWVRRKLGDRAERIERGLRRDGPFFLFSLRLIPVIPFFAVNLLMGLTPIPVWTFFWVSLVGMLAGTAVYVNAGTQLAQLDSLSGILSPGLLFSFGLLAAFPWIARLVLRAI